MQDPQLSFLDRLARGWNAFKNKDPATGGEKGDASPWLQYGYGNVSYHRPDKVIRHYGVDHTIAIAIYNRIATDAASVTMQHIREDELGGFVEEIPSGLNNILTTEANIDQTGSAFLQDLVMSMLDEGVVAAVPIDTTINPMVTGSYDILTMRTAKIVEWRPRHVKVECYDDRRGYKDFLTLPKDKVAIVENPFYEVMNEPNSTLKRLLAKLALLDDIDEQSGSGKLDLVIQLPYVVKSQTRQEQAEERRKQIETQLQDSKYGIAYIDGTERITQLNRPVENNLMAQIEYLTNMLYGQLGMNQDILNGTASEDAMLNYYTRTIDVILNAITDEFERKFLTKTARTQRQAIRFYRDPFSMTPTNAIADIADKFTRNEILTPNEVRGIVGFKPADDPQADELRNRNINQNSETILDETETGEFVDPETGELLPDTGEIPQGASEEPEIDPETGWEIDPETGGLIDPETGVIIDPETGEPLE